jgi:hypothetical protein
MANIMLDNITNSATVSPFVNLPGELRNAIYNFYFETIFESQGLKSNAVCRRVESLWPALLVLRTSRAIRNEASSIFWIDYVTRCHWDFGAHHDDDDHMAAFCESARRYTLDVDITFQKRQPNTLSMSANIVWLVLRSTLDLPKDEEVLQRLREEWKISHRNLDGFVWLKHIGFGSCDNGVSLKYSHHPSVRSDVQFYGKLAMIEWREIFDLAEEGTGLRL